MLLGSVVSETNKYDSGLRGFAEPSYEQKRFRDEMMGRPHRSCFFWSWPFQQDAQYVPMSARGSRPGVASAALLRVRPSGPEVLNGVGQAVDETPLWATLLPSIFIEVCLYMALSSIFQVKAVWLYFAAWLNVRCFLHNAAYCMGNFTRARTRVLTYLAAMAPFAWLLPWINVFLFRSCQYRQTQNIIGADNVFMKSEVLCPGNVVIGNFWSVGSLLAPLIQLGIPIAFVIMFFKARGQLVSLVVRDHVWKLQILALDVLDICVFSAQALDPETFIYLQRATVIGSLFLAMVPLAIFSVLFETATVFRITDNIRWPGAPTPSTALPERTLRRVTEPRVYTVAALLSLNLPFLLFRLSAVPQGISMTQPEWLLKNIVCCLNLVAIMVSGCENNGVTRSFRQLVGMLPAHEIAEQAVAAEIYADSSIELREKVEEVTLLLDTQTEATQRLAFQRAILGAQASIFEGVSELNIRALIEGFQAFDVNHDQRLSRDEVRVMMRTVANIVSEHEVDRLMNLADVNGDGMLDYREFANALVVDPAIKQSVTNPQRHSAFNVFR